MFNLKSQIVFTSGCAGVLVSCKNTFPTMKSIAAIIRSRYGDKILKMVRKLEKLDFKLRKAKLDVKFLCKCENNEIITTFYVFSNS